MSRSSPISDFALKTILNCCESHGVCVDECRTLIEEYRRLRELVPFENPRMVIAGDCVVHGPDSEHVQNVARRQKIGELIEAELDKEFPKFFREHPHNEVNLRRHEDGYRCWIRNSETYRTEAVPKPTLTEALRVAKDQSS